MKEQVWPKTIKVDKRIVKLLSGATYENFPKALKELIVNSYDADATYANISINFKNESISIVDDGHGMSEVDYDFYLRIAFQSREKEGLTKSGRRIIGQFGVGFLSVFPFCKNYYIESTKFGSDEIVYANIPTSNYFTKANELIEVDHIQIPGGKKIDKTVVNKHFTKIILRGFTELTQQFFFPKYKTAPNRFSIRNWKSLDQLNWIMAEDLPISYENERFNNLFNYHSETPFTVTINNKEIKRKAHAKTILETHRGDHNKIGKIKFKYFIATNYNVIHPLEARYLKIRNLNVGVGNRQTFGAGTESGTRASLAHLTGEVHIIDGLNESISLDRDKFNYDEDYENLKEFFRTRLVNLATHTYEINIFSKEVKKVDRVTDLKLIDSQTTLQKIDKLKEKGFKVVRRNIAEEGEPIQINKEKKVVFLSNNEDDFKRELYFRKKKYYLELDNWEYQTDIYPAIMLKGKKLLINKNYPLFKGKKYTDVFFRFHLLLLLNLEEKIITNATFKKINNDILETFTDYLG